MKTAVTVLGFVVLTCCGWAVAQDLPPDILADQYLLEAAKAMEKGDTRAALRAFGKIEALDTEPPLEFLYFYGKLLVENSTALDDLLKGQSLLKQYVLSIEKGSERYRPTLELLSAAGGKLEEIAERRTEAERKRKELLPLLPQLLSQLEKQMVRVDGGRFRMGCQTGRDTREWECPDSEKPVHWVQVRSFEIGKYEVTQLLWEAVMGENPSEFGGCPQCPVERVSWDDVQVFLSRLNARTGKRYRLPTEAEWEYAAFGGQHSRGYQYAGGNDVDSVGWWNSSSGDRTHPVGQKRANELGLHDMTGNVWEWVQDCWNDSYRGAPDDGRAWERRNCRNWVKRGGSWSTGTLWGIRVVNRIWDFSFREDLGFRIARTLTP